jgi:hypothetical protein
MPNKTLLNTEVNKNQFVRTGVVRTCSLQLDHVLYSESIATLPPFGPIEG